MNNKTSYKYPFAGKGRLKTKQSGMTLIEVLVAVFVLALGVLALLAVQLRAVSGVREAESQTIVSQIAQNLIEGMVINPTLSSDSATGWTKKSYTDYIMESPSSAKNYVDNKGKPCPSSLPSNGIDSEQLTKNQICQFKNSIRNALGSNTDLQFIICLDSKGTVPTLKDGKFDGNCDEQGNVTYIKAAWSEDAETASDDKSSNGLTKDGNKIVYTFQAQIADN